MKEILVKIFRVIYSGYGVTEELAYCFDFSKKGLDSAMDYCERREPREDESRYSIEVDGEIYADYEC